MPILNTFMPSLLYGSTFHSGYSPQLDFTLHSVYFHPQLIIITEVATDDYTIALNTIPFKYYTAISPVHPTTVSELQQLNLPLDIDQDVVVSPRNNTRGGGRSDPV